ncbi:hypothetical protein P43SY_010451 [Pythium insidiosum]|uniref:Sphingomyelin synthase-like domain-containing protein n=1 Tax=Pythium insidiosum TaxID=114742 RepID=A0AAD5Q6J6_PYTIN|nr:hypothetical protein P43SY_010451 [Pythium insidiosum]
MPSLLPFSFTPRTKRKMSSLEKGSSLDEFELLRLDARGALSAVGAGAAGSSLTRAWCELCRTVDLKEVLGFVVFEVLTVLIAVLGCLDWILFFKFVVEPDDHKTRAQWGGIWVVFTACVLYFRALVRSKADQNMRSLADHAETFIAVSMVMVFSTNIAFILHTPSTTPLRDLGFMLIPEQAVDSRWRPLSDILTAAVPVLFLVQAHVMTRENRCRVMNTFFRVATISYALRMCTVSLTSLPGPAPHCRPGSGNYFPPQSWIDVVTRIGPMYGNYNSCGDLIFSGHMAYTTSAVLLYLRVLDRHFPRFSHVRWALGVTYLFVLAALCVSGRKHYTVDVVLGVMIATLVFFHFEHGWTPLFWQFPHGRPVTATTQLPASMRYMDKRYSIEIRGDDEDEAMDELDDARRSNERLLSGHHKKVPAADFIC